MDTSRRLFTWEDADLPGRELFLATRDGSQLPDLTTSDGWGCRQPQADSQVPAKCSMGCKEIWSPHRGCKRQDQKNKIKILKKRIELLRGPGNSFSPSGCWLTSYPSPLRGVVSQCPLHASYYPHEINQHSIQLTRSKYLHGDCRLSWQSQQTSTIEFLWGGDSFPLTACGAWLHIKKWYWEKPKGKKKKKEDKIFQLSC